jgi:predicted restriction endonuclease
VQAITEASGLDEAPNDPAAVERARRAALRAARRSAFGRIVVKAYAGYCAVCGLDSNLIEGAHIYPVEAPGSHDEIWNGLALCPNHHRAFDRHNIFIQPGSWQIVVHPELEQTANQSAAGQAFLGSMKPTLTLPADVSDHPRPEVFVRRYAYFFDEYDWAN